MDIKSDIIYTYQQNNKVLLYLLDNIEEEWLSIKLGESGKSIGEQFIHINNIRSFWVSKVAEKVDLKLDKKFAKNKAEIKKALIVSGQKMGKTLEDLFQAESIKGFKPHPTAFFAQMISHESHHRGQIMVTVTRNKLPISKSVNFGLWNWENK